MSSTVVWWSYDIKKNDELESLMFYPLLTENVKWISLLTWAVTVGLNLGPLASSSQVCSFHTVEMSPVTCTHCLLAVVCIISIWPCEPVLKLSSCTVSSINWEMETSHSQSMGWPAYLISAKAKLAWWPVLNANTEAIDGKRRCPKWRHCMTCQSIA